MDQRIKLLHRGWQPVVGNAKEGAVLGIPSDLARPQFYMPRAHARPIHRESEPLFACSQLFLASLGLLRALL